MEITPTTKEAFVTAVNNALTAKGHQIPADKSPTEDDFDMEHTVQQSVENWIEHGDLQKLEED